MSKRLRLLDLPLEEEKKDPVRRGFMQGVSARRAAEYRVLYDTLTQFPGELIHAVMDYTPVYSVAQIEPCFVGEFATKETDDILVSDGSVLVTRYVPETKAAYLDLHTLVQDGQGTSLQPIYSVRCGDQPVRVLLDDASENFVLLESFGAEERTYFLQDRSEGRRLWARALRVPNMMKYIGHGYAFVSYADVESKGGNERYPVFVDIRNRLNEVFHLKEFSPEFNVPACVALSRSQIVHFCVQTRDELLPPVSQLTYNPLVPRQPIEEEPMGILKTQSEVSVSLSDSKLLEAPDSYSTMMRVHPIADTTQRVLLQVFRVYRRRRDARTFSEATRDPCRSSLYVVTVATGRVIQTIDMPADQCLHARPHVFMPVGPSYVFEITETRARLRGLAPDVDPRDVEMKLPQQQGGHRLKSGTCGRAVLIAVNPPYAKDGENRVWTIYLLVNYDP